MYATCARNVKYIILNKGGKTLSLSTYHLWKRKSDIITLPVGMVRINCIIQNYRYTRLIFDIIMIIIL